MAEHVHAWERQFGADGTRRFVLRWQDVNFNAATVFCTMPQPLVDAAAALNVAFSGLAIRYAGALAGVSVRCLITNNRTGATGYTVTVAEFVTAAATETHLIPLHDMPFIWSTDVINEASLVSYVVSGQAATDDIYTQLWGRVQTTQETASPYGAPPTPVALEAIKWPLGRRV